MTQYWAALSLLDTLDSFHLIDENADTLSSIRTWSHFSRFLSSIPLIVKYLSSIANVPTITRSILQLISVVVDVVQRTPTGPHRELNRIQVGFVGTHKRTHFYAQRRFPVGKILPNKLSPLLYELLLSRIALGRLWPGFERNHETLASEEGIAAGGAAFSVMIDVA